MNNFDDMLNDFISLKLLKGEDMQCRNTLKNFEKSLQESVFVFK